MSSFDNMSLDLSSLSSDEREAFASVLKQHIDNYDNVVSGDEPLDIPEDVAAEIRDRVMNSVKLGDLSAEVVRFGTIGFVKVFMAMISPALNPKRFDDTSDDDK